MNRGTFLKTLIGLPAGLVAAAKAYARPAARFVWFIDWEDVRIGPGQGCTLTRMHTTPLTPSDIEAMAAGEFEFAKKFKDAPP